MVIEDDARWYIREAIDLEKIVHTEESKKLDQASSESEFIEKICKINSVANPEGKGWDDLKLEVLNKAKAIVTEEMPKQVIFMAEKVMNSYKNIRALFWKYDENMEVVDP